MAGEAGTDIKAEKAGAATKAGAEAWAGATTAVAANAAQARTVVPRTRRGKLILEILYYRLTGKSRIQPGSMTDKIAGAIARQMCTAKLTLRPLTLLWQHQ